MIAQRIVQSNQMDNANVTLHIIWDQEDIVKNAQMDNSGMDLNAFLFVEFIKPIIISRENANVKKVMLF